ncbi:ribosomal protein S18-alanine N-acetyltransferase [Terrilactibacillus laevilacticus]|uniref:[Ribosomal protein bS18]-alanine N-acetyltransferase n=1 Tax=Terrilactibacillus laevilacticus TaxID=1380157 RepID=A0ABW5PS78_9BACI|nr:ribosomal protein S18-alanine N-acetyltransferase [Terrilactibacillus laevilacticus]
MNETDRVTIRPMNLNDIDDVLIVEHQAFATPWTRQAFENELTINQYATYFVAEHHQRSIGYCGVWVIIDEAHITNLAVLPEYRGKKIGETLLRKVLLFAAMKRAKSVTLECRVSNHIAQNLYTKLGFKKGGIRKSYYSDNHEDAIVMWVNIS